MTASKETLPSRYVTEGVESSFHRVFYYAMGLSSEEIHQPHVGVVTAWDDLASAALHLRVSASTVKDHLWSAGLTPREFTTIPGYDTETAAVGLAARELIADSCELTVRGHSYDGLVGFADSPRALIGLAMAALRLDVPSLLVPCLPTADRGAASGVSAALTVLDLTIDDEPSPEAVAEAFAKRLREWRRPRAAVTGETVRAAAQRCAELGAPVETLVHLAALAHEVGIHLPADALASSTTTGTDLGLRYAALAGATSSERAVYAGPELSAAVTRTARCFEQEQEAIAFASTSWTPSDELIVLRGQGVHGVPAVPSCADLIDAVTRRGADVPPVVWTDGLAPTHPGVALISCSTPEAADGGPIGTVRDGSVVTLDVDAGTLSCGARTVPDLAPPPAAPMQPAVLWKYTQLVGPLIDGAITHPGASAEGVCYVDL